MDSKTQDQILEGKDTLPAIQKKTLAENCDAMAEGILRMLDTVEAYEWSEWDVFSGRMIHRKQPLRDAQKQAISAFIKAIIEK